MLEMEAREVEFYAPVTSDQQESNPCYRDDPSQPVPQEQWCNMRRNSQGRLDKSSFVYDADQDQYYCPQGHAMPFDKMKPGERSGVRVTLRVYRCDACDGCPLASDCISPTNKHGRTITRDGYEEVRARTAQRMAQDGAREIYNQRPRIAETPFGILKSMMGVRQFLLRGLPKVQTEWRWAATAFNLGKLAREIGRLRAEFAELATGAEG